MDRTSFPNHKDIEGVCVAVLRIFREGDSP